MRLTQEALGERAGYGENARIYVSKIERGDNKVSSAKAREQLAKGFGISVALLTSYLDGDAPLERVLSATHDESQVPKAAVRIEDAQSAVEEALGMAFDARVHSLKDLDAVRASIRRIHKLEAAEADAIGAARMWLDAAARLRKQDKTVDLEALLVAVTLGTKALPQEISRAASRDAAATAEAEAELRALGGEPGQGAEMGERLRRLASKQSDSE